MKKNLFFSATAALMLSITSCQESKQQPDFTALQTTDSLQSIIDQKDNEINDLMGTFNLIEEGFRQINEAEGRVNVAKTGEGADQRQQIMENVQYISDAMKKNRALIAKLRKQLRESSLNTENMQATIDNLTKELEQKDAELKALREELDAKDIHIAELDETITSLNTDVASLKEDNIRKDETISNQDSQLHTAWYAFGTKKELKEQHIIEGGTSDVLQSNFNKSYFKEIDIRVDKEVKLCSKYAKVLTNHPSASYTLEKDANKQYVLRITDPDTFWSTSKYLVVLVK